MNEDKFVSNSHGDGCEWQFNTSAMSQMSRSPYLSASMVEAFSPGYWNHSTSSLNLCFGESSATTVNSIPAGKPVAVSLREMLVSTAPRNSPTSLPHFPVDSSFIEREARFSCFSTGNFTGINFFGPSPAMAPPNNEGLGARIQKDELNENKAVLLPISNGESHVVNFPEDSPEGNTGSIDVALDSSSSDLGENKRRKKALDIGKDQVQGGLQSLSQTTKENIEDEQKLEQISSKQSGNNGKDSSEVAKEDYVHIRARRGQATNSHSLAERVRREKISERMKCLQELVPGCSKVTGKAVMLDEIINYVQSLQRQVEFLSMKLAAVNPQLDFGIEGLLAKNLLHSHGGGSSSATGFSPVSMYPQPYPSQHTGISAMASQSHTFRRAISTQSSTSGYKESLMQVQQMHSPWDEELIMQMAHGATPSNPHEMDSKADGFTA